MKKLLLIIVVLMTFSFSADTYKLSTEDREMILKHLSETKEHLTETLNGLTSTQLNFKPSETSWSIAECVEHLALTEKTFIQLVNKSVSDGPKPELKNTLVFQDEQIMPMISDRSQKVSTSEPFIPSGQFGSTDETLDAFLETRNELMFYAQSTEDDLRNRYITDLPFGTVDGVQFIVFIAGHTERHVLQMKEVMGNEAYPKME